MRDQLAREGFTHVSPTLVALMGTLQANQERRERRHVDESRLSDAEVRLAQELTAIGLVFGQQFPIGPYDADFYFESQKLCVEVDGGQHYTEAGLKHDARRDRALRDRGITTMRIPARDVYRNPHGTAERIWYELARRNAALLDPERAAIKSLDVEEAEAGNCDDCGNHATVRIHYGRFGLCVRCGLRRRAIG